MKLSRIPRNRGGPMRNEFEYGITGSYVIWAFKSILLPLHSVIPINKRLRFKDTADAKPFAQTA